MFVIGSVLAPDGMIFMLTVQRFDKQRESTKAKRRRSLIACEPCYRSRHCVKNVVQRPWTVILKQLEKKATNKSKFGKNSSERPFKTVFWHELDKFHNKVSSGILSAILLFHPFTYELIYLNYFYAIVDINPAWCWVTVHPQHRQLQGFRWMFHGRTWPFSLVLSISWITASLLAFRVLQPFLIIFPMLLFLMTFWYSDGDKHSGSQLVVNINIISMHKVHYCERFVP